MYGKLFTQMYDGTLATKGPWQALVTFQQMLILCDKDGVIDMTPEAISRRTTIPIEIIEIGIPALEEVDPASRSPELEGRRIVRLSESREWGWQIVNYAKYRKIRSEEDRKEYMRNYQKNYRKRAVNNSKQVNTPLAMSTNSISRSNKSTCSNSDGFELFWDAYPKKRNKQSARKAWDKIKPTESMQEKILAVLPSLASSRDWSKENRQFCPLPATWLNAGGWDDEIVAQQDTRDFV